MAAAFNCEVSIALGPLLDPEIMCTNRFPTFIQVHLARRKMNCQFCEKQRLAFRLTNVVKGSLQLGVGI
jgi:hypothetical protein